MRTQTHYVQDIKSMINQPSNERRGRKASESAWKVSAIELAQRNYKLDCKNPHEVEVNHGDPHELMREYKEIVRQLEAAQAAPKQELMESLGRER